MAEIEMSSEAISRAEASLADFSEKEATSLSRKIKGDQAMRVAELKSSKEKRKVDSAREVERLMSERMTAAAMAKIATDWLSGKERGHGTELPTYLWLKSHHDAAEITVNRYAETGYPARMIRERSGNDPGYTPTSLGLNEAQAKKMVRETSVVLQQIRAKSPFGAALIDNIEFSLPATAGVDSSTKDAIADLVS